MKILKKEKWEYYSGKSEKPFELKILRQDIPTYLESDEDLIRLQSKLDYLKVVNEYLEHIVKNLHKSTFSIKKYYYLDKIYGGWIMSIVDTNYYWFQSDP